MPLFISKTNITQLKKRNKYKRLWKIATKTSIVNLENKVTLGLRYIPKSVSKEKYKACSRRHDAAVSAIVEIGPPAVPFLTRVLQGRQNSPTGSDITLAQNIMMRMGEKLDVEPVIQALRNETWNYTPKAIIEVLAQCRMKAGLDALLAWFLANDIGHEDLCYFVARIDLSAFCSLAPYRESIATAFVEKYKKVPYHGIMDVLGKVGDEKTFEFIQSEYDKCFEYLPAHYIDDEVRPGRWIVRNPNRNSIDSLVKAAFQISERNHLSRRLTQPGENGDKIQ